MRKIALFLILCIFSASLALAVGIPSIAIRDSSIEQGSTIAVPITIEGADEIAGGSLNISFNPEFISVNSIASGDFGTPTYNIGNGFASISLTGITVIGKSNATLAIVTFKGEKTGTSTLEIKEAFLNKVDGSSISPSVLNSTMTVGSANSPTPRTNNPQTNQLPLVTSTGEKPGNTDNPEEVPAWTEKEKTGQQNPEKNKTAGEEKSKQTSFPTGFSWAVIFIIFLIIKYINKL